MPEPMPSNTPADARTGGRLAGVEIPTVVQGAIITILVAAAGYVVRDPARS